MDRFSEQFHHFLLLAHGSALLVSKEDLANLSSLLNLVAPADRTILISAYGLFGEAVTTVDDMADKYKIDKDVIGQRIERDLRLIAVSPEWQMMLRQLRPAVQKRIGFVK